MIFASFFIFDSTVSQKMDHFDISFACSIFSKSWEVTNYGFLGAPHLPVTHTCRCPLREHAHRTAAAVVRMGCLLLLSDRGSWTKCAGTGPARRRKHRPLVPQVRQVPRLCQVPRPSACSPRCVRCCSPTERLAPGHQYQHGLC